jgi:trehalose 6-phosphate synthase
MSTLLIANIRGPVTFSADDSGTLWPHRGGGGVVSGLSSLVTGGDTVWICAAQHDADRSAAARAPGGWMNLDGSPGGRQVRMLDIPDETFRRAHAGLANSTLWFVHHMLYDIPRHPGYGPSFRQDWAAYQAYNRAFAEALAAQASSAQAGAAEPDGPVRVLVQDYHLSLVPLMLAQLRPDLRIAHFTHTPWAPRDYYAILPGDVAAAVLEGVLGADQAGFHCRPWADAFMDCAEAVLGAQVDRVRRQVLYQGRVTGIGEYPLGVAADELAAQAAEPEVQARMRELAAIGNGRKLIVRIDRTELSKNILRGLAAYHELLRTRPEWRGKIVHLAFAYPSRQDLPDYRAYMAQVRRKAEQISAEFGTVDWEPLIFGVEDDYARSLAAMRLADVLLVNPVRDGMNLVAKEGPVLSERGCVLVLSRSAGAAEELGADALLVNPFDVSETAAALHQALTMNQAERSRRCASLARIAGEFPPRQWLARQLDGLTLPDPA